MVEAPPNKKNLFNEPTKIWHADKNRFASSKRPVQYVRSVMALILRGCERKNVLFTKTAFTVAVQKQEVFEESRAPVNKRTNFV